MEIDLPNQKSDSDYSEFAYQILKLGFVLAPIIAGLDKFYYRLTDWTKYLSPVFNELLNIAPRTFMYGAGIIEIIAGVGVLLKPRIFAYVVSAWLIGIIINLFFLGEFYDIALRDFGLSLGAFALGQLAVLHERHAHESDHGHVFQWRHQ